MGFIAAVKTCFRKFVDFKGRAPRSEYWWFVLFTYLVAIILQFVFAGLSAINPEKTVSNPFGAGSSIVVIIAVIISLILYIPYFAVSFRRIHDVNRSGWWIGAPIILSFVFLLFPLLGVNLFLFAGLWSSTLYFVCFLGYAILLLIWFCTLGTIGENKYGPDPLAGQHSEETLSRHNSAHTES